MPAFGGPTRAIVRPPCTTRPWRAASSQRSASAQSPPTAARADADVVADAFLGKVERDLEARDDVDESGLEAPDLVGEAARERAAARATARSVRAPIISATASA